MDLFFFVARKRNMCFRFVEIDPPKERKDQEVEVITIDCSSETGDVSENTVESFTNSKDRKNTVCVSTRAGTTPLYWACS